MTYVAPTFSRLVARSISSHSRLCCLNHTIVYHTIVSRVEAIYRRRDLYRAKCDCLCIYMICSSPAAVRLPVSDAVAFMPRWYGRFRKTFKFNGPITHRGGSKAGRYVILTFLSTLGLQNGLISRYQSPNKSTLTKKHQLIKNSTGTDKILNNIWQQCNPRLNHILSKLQKVQRQRIWLQLHKKR